LSIRSQETAENKTSVIVQVSSRGASSGYETTSGDSTNLKEHSALSPSSHPRYSLQVVNEGNGSDLAIVTSGHKIVELDDPTLLVTIQETPLNSCSR